MKGLGLYSNFAYNIKELGKIIIYQVGGMRVVVSITIAPRIVVIRYVSKILLRWYLTQLQNKINTVTIISAHIPYELSSSGIRTMYKHTIYV